MDRISLGFVLAALYNICIVLFSRGFSGDLGAVDPLFRPGGWVAWRYRERLFSGLQTE